VAFRKVALAAGTSTTIDVVIDPRELSLVDANGVRSVQPGDYDLYVGGQQPAQGSGILLPFHIEGSSEIAR
jgi:beta-glucosidase